MKKVAIVVQRYGLSVNGGAEYHARLLAEQLNALYEVEVLTSCAQDYHTWANTFSEGIDLVNGIKVRRFSVKHPRNKAKVHRLLKRLNKRTLLQRSLRRLSLLARFEKLFELDDNFEALGAEWSRQQGPYTPTLISYLKENQDSYDAIIFFTYLYYPTFLGLAIAPSKSILIPTAHDEPAIHLPVFKSFFHLPKAILYNTASEKRLVTELFDNGEIYNDVVGIGISQSEETSVNSIKELLDFDEPYLIYIGRIDPGKGADTLLEYFLQFKKAFVNPVKLVLIGQSFFEIPKQQDVVHMGFVSENIKITLLKGALALVMPSPHESLSLVTLESLLNGVPVIVNGFSEVLVDHVLQSKAGFIFKDFDSFASSVLQVLENSEGRELMSALAKTYVNENYRWELVLKKFKKAIDFISE